LRPQVDVWQFLNVNCYDYFMAKERKGYFNLHSNMLNIGFYVVRCGNATLRAEESKQLQLFLKILKLHLSILSFFRIIQCLKFVYWDHHPQMNIL
jgi:hypothetical protein